MLNRSKIGSFPHQCTPFIMKPTSRFGDRLKEQVETRMKYLNDGGEIEKNEEIMEEIMT
jgi:hypothetical protein